MRPGHKSFKQDDGENARAHTPWHTHTHTHTHTNTQEDGTLDKVELLLRGGDTDGDGLISREELSDMMTAIYLTSCSVRGKYADLPLLEAAVDSRIGQIPDGVLQDLQLLAQPAEPWQDGTQVAVLDLNEGTTVGDFAKVVGNVVSNYTFAVANKDKDDKLDVNELEAWIQGRDTSYEVVEHLLKSTLYTTQQERQPLLDYLQVCVSVKETYYTTKEAYLCQLYACSRSTRATWLVCLISVGLYCHILCLFCHILGPF